MVKGDTGVILSLGALMLGITLLQIVCAVVAAGGVYAWLYEAQFAAPVAEV